MDEIGEGYRFDFGYIQDSQIGLPSVKGRKRIMVGTETSEVIRAR